MTRKWYQLMKSLITRSLKQLYKTIQNFIEEIDVDVTTEHSEVETFKPVTATIVLNTQEEVNALYNLCNHGVMIKFMQLQGLDVYPIAQGLSRFRGCNRFPEFRDAMAYSLKNNL